MGAPLALCRAADAQLARHGRAGSDRQHRYAIHLQPLDGSTLTPRLDGTYNSEIPFSATDLANPFFKQEAYWV